MTEFERKIYERFERLEAEIRALKSAKSVAEEATEFERLPPTATVGKEYIAYRFGCSVRAVVRKEAGTHRIKLVSARPMKAIKRDVDEAFRLYKQSPAERAAAARAKAPRRRSIISKRETI